MVPQISGKGVRVTGKGVRVLGKVVRDKGEVARDIGKFVRVLGKVLHDKGKGTRDIGRVVRVPGMGRRDSGMGRRGGRVGAPAPGDRGPALEAHLRPRDPPIEERAAVWRGPSAFQLAEHQGDLPGPHETDLDAVLNGIEP
jgi:hypothetical protein